MKPTGNNGMMANAGSQILGCYTQYLRYAVKIGCIKGWIVIAILKYQYTIRRGLDKNAFSVFWMWKWFGIVYVCSYYV